MSGVKLTKAETWKSLRDIVSWLKANDPGDDDRVDAETADAAQSLLDILERAEANPPTIWWHGGDAIVLNFGGDGATNHMLTISGDAFHVHYPRTPSGLQALGGSNAPVNEVQFRLHRGGLAESMATARSIVTMEDLVKALDEDGWPHGDIDVKPYARDDRIGWDTHIVTVDGMAAGFTSGPFRPPLTPNPT